MTEQQLKNLNEFHNQCWTDHRQPEDERRHSVSRRSALLFMGAASVMALFSIISFITQYLD
jgi:hypothetical protein